MNKEGSEAEAYESAERMVTIKNKYGIHARPAALFVKMAGRFRSEISVEKEGMVVAGKSIMGLLTLEGYFGAALKITAVGPDAEDALDALEELVNRKFDEE